MTLCRDAAPIRRASAAAAKIMSVVAVAVAAMHCGDGEDGGGGSEPTTNCLGAMRCGDACVDAANDPTHCGACDTVCSEGEICSSGECTVACLGGSTRCDDRCVDTQTDPAHCGECAHVCADGEVCSGGECALQCGGGTTRCDDRCVDTQTDPAHCGECAHVCADGEVCTSGDCALQCGGGTTLCDDVCTNTEFDPANCGQCGFPCPIPANASATCGGGECSFACDEGFGDCNGPSDDGCETDLLDDESNCGTCGNVCAPDQPCVAGECGVLPDDIAASLTFTDALPLHTMGLAFDGSSYWSVAGGDVAGLRLARYDAAGIVQETYSPGLDFRSIFTTGGMGGTVYARTYASAQILEQTAPGIFSPAISLSGGSLGGQDAVVINPAGTELIAMNSGTVSRWNSAGTLLGTVTLQGYGSMNGEDQYPQSRGIAIAGDYYLTYSNGFLSAWDEAGTRLDVATLTGAGTNYSSHFGFSFAAGRFWVVDNPGSTWRGYSLDL